MTAITPAGSPFDAIRRVDEDGEHWTGREMQPLMEYPRWEDFATVIEKAKDSLALVEGRDQAEHHFGRSRSDGGRWGNQRLDDYRLSRFAAYLTAMAGDDTKEAVAHARVYFATKTREAEIAPPSTTVALPQDYEEALTELLEKVRQNKVLAVENAKLKAKADAFDEWINGKGCYLIGSVAKMRGLGPNTLWEFLYAERIIIRAPGSKRHREPYSRKDTVGWFEVKPVPPDRANGHAARTTYVTPYGAERIRLLLIRRGVLHEQLTVIGGGR